LRHAKLDAQCRMIAAVAADGNFAQAGG